MESIHDLAPEIQKRLSDLVRKLNKRGMSKPETKNISALVRRLIQTRQVMVMPVVRVLGEKIAPKKTWERLTRNMGKEGLWERLLSAHREQQRGVIRKMPYCIIDLSDIQKPYAEKMEGLTRVRDGDKKGEKKEPVIGNGYNWLNAVMADREEICIRKYAAIKTLGVLVMMAAAFCARLPYALVIKLMAVTNQLPHRRLSDIPNFPYYKIASAVAAVINATIRRPHLPLKIRKRNYFQLELCLGEF